MNTTASERAGEELFASVWLSEGEGEGSTRTKLPLPRPLPLGRPLPRPLPLPSAGLVLGAEAGSATKVSGFLRSLGVL